MATHEIPILGFSTLPDSSGNVFFQDIETLVATAAANLAMLGFAMPDPGAADEGLFGKLNIPQNYVGTPVLVIRGILNGTPANTLAFGLQQTGGIASSETVDVAFETEDLASNAVWTGFVDEDLYEETITITPGSDYVAGDEVFFKFFRDGSVDDATFEFVLTGLFLRYNDS